MRSRFLRSVLIAIAAGVLCTGAKAEDNNCDNQPLPEHSLQAQPGDIVQPAHLHFVRPFSGTGKLEISICNADVKLVNRADGKTAEVLVDLSGSTGGHQAADFVKTFRVAANDGIVQFKFPESAHAKVTLILPMKRGSDLEFNLGKGDLSFHAGGSAGERQINVGMGSMTLYVNDASYAEMQVNIGMGTLHDRRPGGKDGHFVVNREFQASGDGSLQINVGMGTLDIERD